MNEDLLDQVRALRARGRSPKEIGRALKVSQAKVAPLVRALAAQELADSPDRPILGCWVSPGWNSGLTFHGHPDWPISDDPEGSTAGLVTVAVCRKDRGSRASVCNYLVDVYCLGVKNALPPRIMDQRATVDFVETLYGSYDGKPVEAPIDLAQHLVLGAIEYARGLGFSPHPDFEAAAGHLGEWSGPSDITFGKDGKPLYLQGPHDNPSQIVATLNDSVGLGNYELLITM